MANLFSFLAGSAIVVAENWKKTETNFLHERRAACTMPSLNPFECAQCLGIGLCILTQFPLTRKLSSLEYDPLLPTPSLLSSRRAANHFLFFLHLSSSEHANGNGKWL